MTTRAARAKSAKRNGKTRRAVPKKGKQHPKRLPAQPTHVTAAGDNVFRDLGFSPEEAENLKVRAQIMNEIRAVVDDLTQVDAARLLGVSQPRVSDLKRGKIGLFTIDALVNMLAHAGVTMRFSVSRSKRTAA
jgi:predicted XRE-type DNA-binding protein